MIYVVLVIMVLFNATANTVLRVGMSGESGAGIAQTILKGATNPMVLLGVLLFTCGLSLYFYVLSKLSLSVAYPMVISLELIAVLLFSWLFLKEQITVPHMFGSFFILCGIWLVAK